MNNVDNRSAAQVLLDTKKGGLREEIPYEIEDGYGFGIGVFAGFIACIFWFAYNPKNTSTVHIMIIVPILITIVLLLFNGTGKRKVRHNSW